MRMSMCRVAGLPVDKGAQAARDGGMTVSKNDDRCATCFVRTRSEEPCRANCCARYPLPEGVGEYVVSRSMQSHASRSRQCFYPAKRFTPESSETLFNWKGTHHRESIAVVQQQASGTGDQKRQHFDTSPRNGYNTLRTVTTTS